MQGWTSIDNKESPIARLIPATRNGVMRSYSLPFPEDRRFFIVKTRPDLGESRGLGKAVILLVLLFSSFFVNAGYVAVVASDAEIAKLKSGQEAKTGTPPESLPGYAEIERELTSFSTDNMDIAQCFAGALITVVVRKATGEIRRELPSGRDFLSFKKRIRDIDIGYDAVLYEGKIIRENCSLGISGHRPWRTSNGRWEGDGILVDDMKDAITRLNSAGFVIGDVSMSLKTHERMENARSLLRKLGLEKNSLVGVSAKSKEEIFIGIGK